MKKTKANPELPHMINLVVGDWSHDGHNMTEQSTIKCNLEKKDLEKAYKKGTKVVGFNLTEEVCADYEDMSMPAEIAEKLKVAGIDANEYVEHEDGEELSFAYNHEAFTELWLRIAQLGNPDLKYEMSSNESPNINIGGYGLLGS